MVSGFPRLLVAMVLSCWLVAASVVRLILWCVVDVAILICVWVVIWMVIAVWFGGWGLGGFLCQVFWCCVGWWLVVLF